MSDNIQMSLLEAVYFSSSSLILGFYDALSLALQKLQPLAFPLPFLCLLCFLQLKF